MPTYTLQGQVLFSLVDAEVPEVTTAVLEVRFPPRVEVLRTEFRQSDDPTDTEVVIAAGFPLPPR